MNKSKGPCECRGGGNKEKINICYYKKYNGAGREPRATLSRLQNNTLQNRCLVMIIMKMYDNTNEYFILIQNMCRTCIIIFMLL